MKTIKFLLLSTFFSFSILTAYGQRTIKGIIIDENLEVLPEVGVYVDTVKIGKSDLEGFFEIKIPEAPSTLNFGWFGYEWTSILITENCDYLEIILLPAGIYHYRSHRKIDRIRKRLFGKIPGIHHEAFQKGIFKNNKPCFKREFVPIKPELDEIRIQLRAKLKQNNKDFEKLAIGDTIRIPYSGSYRDNGTDRTTLFVYSNLFDGEDFDCLIQGIIIGKDKSRKGFNLTYEVTKIDKCKYDSIVYDGEEVVVGQTLKHNMKFFKVLKN